MQPLLEKDLEPGPSWSTQGITTLVVNYRTTDGEKYPVTVTMSDEGLGIKNEITGHEFNLPGAKLMSRNSGHLEVEDKSGSVPLEDYVKWGPEGVAERRTTPSIAE